MSKRPRKKSPNDPSDTIGKHVASLIGHRNAVPVPPVKIGNDDMFPVEAELRRKAKKPRGSARGEKPKATDEQH